MKMRLIILRLNPRNKKINRQERQERQERKGI
jgi:hypothetical protein